MRKIITVLFLIALILLIVGCKVAEPPKLEVEIAEEDLAQDISEIDTLEEDLDLSELDEIDQLLAELES